MRRRISVALSVFINLASAFALAQEHREALFPQPLHITRKVEDSLTGRTTVIDEYCAGNRIVSIGSGRTTVADYAQQQLTEINSIARTYSITRFDAIAAVRPPVPGGAASWKVQPRGVISSATARSLEAFEFREQSSGRSMEVGIDRDVVLSRDALEALLGASYPRSRTAEHEAILGAARQQRQSRASSSAVAEMVYGLPSEQTSTYSAGDVTVTVKSIVTRIGRESAPPEALIIDPAYRRVESLHVRAPRELREADQLPPRLPKP